MNYSNESVDRWKFSEIKDQSIFWVEGLDYRIISIYTFDLRWLNWSYILIYRAKQATISVEDFDTYTPNRILWGCTPQKNKHIKDQQIHNFDFFRRDKSTAVEELKRVINIKSILKAPKKRSMSSGWNYINIFFFLHLKSIGRQPWHEKVADLYKHSFSII